MIAQQVTSTETGEVLDQNGKQLSKSAYKPSKEVLTLFERVQKDYQLAWALQNRPFDEFDGYSLLERANMDQKTFGAYVGAEYVPEHKEWRWKGRKNTARNKIIGILAHVISGMLFPYAYAYNEDDEEDKMTAKVMRILIENHLKKADYELKFLFMVCSALVNPAVFVEVDYIEAIQRVKVKNKDGSYKIEDVVDDLLSGINLNLVPIDQVMLADFYTFDIQRQPNIIRLNRISWDEARSKYAGKYFDENGTDLFDYVQAGKTRVLMGGSENQVLYDVDWTEADANYVQEITAYYRPEDLEVTFVAGVFMGEDKDIYKSNPFNHRRMSMIGDRWVSIPVYNIAKSGFEPIDPSGRFAYYKSAAFKEFWDDAGQNRMHQIAFDGTYLDVIKPMFLSGVTNVDGSVLVPGATIGMPMGASATPYQLGPNLVAALNMMKQEKDDMSESTQDQIMSGITQKGVTAYATSKAEQNAKVIMQVFGVLIADLIRQVGELTMDCIIQHTTIGEVDATVPEALKMKFRTVNIRGKESGKDITNSIQFSTDIMGDNLTPEKANELEWDLFYEMGGLEANRRKYIVNPYKFARTKFSLYIDPEMIVSRSMGTDQLKKERAFNILTDPRVAPFVDQQAVVDKFVLEEFSDGDPDQFKKEVNPNELLQSMMGGGNQQQLPPLGERL